MKNFTFFSFATGKKLYASFLSALGLMMLLISGLSFGQASITSATAVTDPLTSYVGTAPTIPANWTLSYTGGTSHNGTAQTTGTAGGWYGNANISFLGSGSASNGNATWRLQNNSGSTLTGFTLVFTAKMWKSGTNSPNVTVSYTSNAAGTNPTSGALPNSLSSLTFNDATPNVATAGASMTQTVTGLSIASGQYIFVRFIHAGGSSSDNLGWDDLSFTPVLAAATPALTAAATLNETTLNNSTIALTLTNDTFANANPLALSNFTLNNAPAGVSVSNVAFNSATSATVTLAYNNTDFDATVSNLSVTVAKAELATSATALTSTPMMTVTAVNEAIATAPSALTGLGYAFGSGTSPSQSFNISSSNLKLPAGNITITGSTNYEVSTDNSLFSGSVTIPFTTASLSSTPVYVRLKTGLAIATYNSQSITVSGGGASSSVTVSGSVTGASPILTAASGATVDNPFVITFSDDAAWRAASTGITVAGTPLTAGYSVGAGTITFTPSASVPAGLLQLNGTKSIVVTAAGYNAATVSQVISVGAAKKLIMFKQPAAPAINGGVLATQPELVIGDQYNNLTNDTGIPVTAAVGAGAWTLGGTSAVNSNNGTVVYSGLTATSAAAVSGATIAFSAPGLTGVTSAGFNIVAPAPINDNCSTATAITIDAAAVTGNVLNATQSLAATCAGTANDDVWYSFTTAGAGTYRITVVGSASFDAVVDVRSGACNGTNIFCADNTFGGGTETVTATGLLASTTYYIRVYDYSTGYPANPTFTIAVASPPPTLSTNGTTTFSFGNQAPLTQSASQTFNLSGTSLTGAPGNITVTAPNTDFQVSNDNSTWGATTTIAYPTGTLASTPVYVRFTPQSSGSQTGNMTFSGGGTSGNPTIALTGTGVLPAPVAAAATNIAATSFDANWGSVTEASAGYLLDVSTSPTFGTAVSTTLTEGFNAGTTAPSGWVFTSIGSTYTSAGNYGVSSPSLSLDASGDKIQTLVLSGPATQLSFWIKGQGTDALSALLIEGSKDGVLWSTIQNLTSLPTTGTSKVYNSSTVPVLASGFIQFRFTYTKSAGNLAFDDLSITYDMNVPSFVTGYNAKPISGQATVTSSVTGLTPDTTYYYRLRATDGGTPSANSNVITVHPASRGGSVSSDQTICSGTPPATLTLTGNNGTVVKWQKSSDAAFTSPVDIADTSSSLTGTAIGNLTATTYFRAVVQSFANPTANSTYATITVNPLPNGTLTNAGAVCSGTQPQLTFTASSGTAPFTLVINGQTYTNITSGVAFTATGTSPTANTTYTVSSIAGVYCTNPSPSVSTTVTVNPLVSGGTVSGNSTVFLGSTTPYTSNGTTGGTWTSDNPAVASVDSSTGVVTGHALGTAVITYTVSSGCGSSASSATVTVTDVTTWAGTAGAGSWNHGAPNSAIKAAMSGSYDTSVDGEFSAFNLTVNAGGSLVITKDKAVTLAYELTNNGNVMIESDGNLLQVNDSPANTGAISARREITVKDNQQYNYLISPLVGSNLKTNVYEDQVSHALSSAPFTLYYNEANNKFYTSSGAYIPGRGLAVKEPAGVTGKINALFTGVPMNGPLTYALANTGTAVTGYNLIGNPYPSNIDLNLFYNLGTNSSKLNGTFYFWDNTVNSETAQQGSGYSGAAYAVFNAVAGGSGTGLAAGSLSGSITGSKEPTRVVKPGQGFMVRSSSTVDKTIDFSNTIRIPDAGDVFFGKSAKGNTEDDRFYLKLSAPTNITTQAAVVYFANGNDGFAKDDSEMNGAPSDVLYSLIGDKKAVINGRAPFVNTDVVPLGTKHFTTGSYIISLGKKEGIFANGQAIYLNDKNTGTITNLSEGGYTFAVNAGESTGRFEIVYQPETVLATDGAVKEEVSVYRDGTDFVVKAQSKIITVLEVYDMAGRLIERMQPDRLKVTIHSEILSNGAYLLKINQGGATVVKKILK